MYDYIRLCMCKFTFQKKTNESLANHQDTSVKLLEVLLNIGQNFIKTNAFKRNNLADKDN
jgi:hypothetical protein